MRIAIINGPNLNLLGKREPEIYGHRDFLDYLEELRKVKADVELSYFQSNVEGELINALQELSLKHDAIILNAAGYSHTSVALGDTVAAISVPVVEVHITNIHAREEFRIHSYTGAKAAGVISGFGLAGYKMAVEYLYSSIKPNQNH